MIQQATAQEAADLGNQRDKFVIAFKTDCTNKNLYAPDTPDGQNGTKASSYNPLNYVSVSPLTFVTTDDPDEGLHMATITYTVAIPKEDEQGTSTPPAVSKDATETTKQEIEKEE